MEIQYLEDNDNIFCLTAIIDLLGFSNHLTVGSNDIRTNIGSEAIKRLRFIDESIRIFNEEMNKHPNIYPDIHRFHYLRINDSLILNLDLNKQFSTSVGNQIPTADILKKIPTLYKDDEFGLNNESTLSEAHYKIFSVESYNASKFVGLVARIHNYINQREFENNFPGCRTILSSGMRRRYTDLKGEERNEDFLSANFSFSNAFIVTEKGSKEGIEGNKLYLEDYAALVIAQERFTKNILRYSKYLYNPISCDPYDDDISVEHEKQEVTLAKKVKITLFHKEYYFRNLNTQILTLLQIVPNIREYAIQFIKNTPKQDIEEFNEKIPTLEEALTPGMINKKFLSNLIIKPPAFEALKQDESIFEKYPILSLNFELNNDYLDYEKYFMLNLDNK